MGIYIRNCVNPNVDGMDIVKKNILKKIAHTLTDAELRAIADLWKPMWDSDDFVDSGKVKICEDELARRKEPGYVSEVVSTKVPLSERL